ncbi:2OG-Fe dioxygenase family protein [Streptomyces sp. OF8]|uniref:2OG-Fe dioxygenase family protein n=2 Tax=Streptomyces alkaliterrae TaxID=2213162 RepID=A0A5P0YZH0_9ACTN|nr:2OG-Fe dioxygenase family protein [Streptomyces alkaliterrae]MQS05017.1 hypothetical protein [Streptomyces alkaliterrae]
MRAPLRASARRRSIGGMRSDAGAGAAAAVAAGRVLGSAGVCLMPSVDVLACLGVGGAEWERFAAHWDDLVVDRYAAARGTRRLRRYGKFVLTGAGELRPRSHGTFVQPDDTNRLYVGVERRFEPLTDAFVADPVFGKLVGLLGVLARGLEEERDEWVVLVHPFRVIAVAGQDGQPTPEGRHRDGVTLVTSLLVGRENAVGGRSAVYDDGGAPLLAATLDEPGALLLGDDRRTEHEVSPIRPLDPAAQAHRDVLVTTLLPVG